MIERGASWGRPTDRPAEIVVRGGDADLADAVGDRTSVRIGFVPDESSDLARAIGIAGRTAPVGGPSFEMPVDVIALSGDADGVVVNAAVLGTPPARLRWTSLGTPVTVHVDRRRVFEGRATTVVVANGEYVDGADVFPRGHPGDGRLEVQVFALARGERRAMRARLPRGEHVPHPRITQASGRIVEVRSPARLPLLADRRHRGAPAALTLEIRSGILTVVR